MHSREIMNKIEYIGQFSFNFIFGDNCCQGAKYILIDFWSNLEL